MLPSVSVPANGYLHAWITTTGEYCSSLAKSTVAATEEPVKNLIPVNENKFLKVYPNPATSLITVELNDKQETKVVVATLYDIFGMRILQESYPRERTHNISLENFPAGLYFLNVTDGDRVSTVKVMKK
jgi:hypothetical protein